MQRPTSFLIHGILLAAVFCSAEAFAGFVPRVQLSHDLRIGRVDRQIAEVPEVESCSGIRLASESTETPEQIYRVDEFGHSLGAIPREISSADISAVPAPFVWRVKAPSRVRVEPDTRLRLPEGFPMCLLKIPIVGC